MGSGQGKARRTSSLQPRLRAQATAVPVGSEKVMLRRKKWEEFVKNIALEGERGRVHHYYLGETKQSPTNADYGKMITELFADAIAVKAIILPEPYTASSFEFVQVGT